MGALFRTPILLVTQPSAPSLSYLWSHLYTWSASYKDRCYQCGKTDPTGPEAPTGNRISTRYILEFTEVQAGAINPSGPSRTPQFHQVGGVLNGHQLLQSHILFPK